MGDRGKAAAGVDNTSRRKWDLDEYADKAAERDRLEEEKLNPPRHDRGEIVVRDALKSRDYQVGWILSPLCRLSVSLSPHAINMHNISMPDGMASDARGCSTHRWTSRHAWARHRSSVHPCLYRSRLVTFATSARRVLLL